MRKLLLSALLASGLTLAGAGAYGLEDQPQEPQTQQQMDQGTEIEQDAQDMGATEQQAPETEATEESATEESQAQGEEYVVQEGDTLSSIAKEKLGSEEQWQSIAEANNLDSPDQLQVGQTLVIPSADDMGSQEQSGFEEGKPSEETQHMQEGTSEQSAPATEQEYPSQNY